MIIGLGQEKQCGKCGGQSDVNVDDSSGKSEFYRYCKCTGKIKLTEEELELARNTYELGQRTPIVVKVCGGWLAAGD